MTKCNFGYLNLEQKSKKYIEFRFLEQSKSNCGIWKSVEQNLAQQWTRKCLK